MLILAVVRKRTDYQERKLPGTFPLWTFAPSSENFRSEQRKYRGAKSPDTRTILHQDRGSWEVHTESGMWI